ncbi:RnfABCDGE type electron transport complex subunit D [bacterium]|nr:RnfABCDGE type electron transport complex subunit D [bacterium]
MPSLLNVSSSPHIRTDDSVPRIMWTVVIALVPTCAYSVYLFGWYTLALILVCVATAVITEAAIQWWRKVPVTVSDGSAVVMGMLVACNIPPCITWWIPVIGTFVGMAIAKHCFGGLGYNIFNPALIGRAFILAAYPKDMTTWKIVGTAAKVDATTTATPLMMLKEHGYPYLIEHFGGDKWALYKDLFIGNVGGCIGETSALLILVGAGIMLARKVITLYIPLSYLGTLALLTFVFKGDPLFAILAGGVMLGAWFMATDMVTSPVTKKGQVIFGAGCGLLTFIIRTYGGYPEGTSYAILLMNATVPLIDRFFTNRVLGTK